MKKTIFITNIIKAIVAFLLLVFVFIQNEPLILRMMIGSFLLLILCYIAENLCNLFQKPSGAKICHKLFIIIFLLFGSSFLVIWSYPWIREKQYFPLIFTLPFWIFEIHIFRKSILEIQSTSKQIQKKFRFDFRIVISSFLVISVLLTGIICLAIGIKNTYQARKNTKNYFTTTGYFKDYEIYGMDEKDNHGSNKHITYRFIYTYMVDGKEYSIKTNYGSGSIPSINSSRGIKYNPDNPSDAVFIGTNSDSVFIYFGAFFFLGGMIFVLSFLTIKGVFDKVKINILGLYAGFVFFVVGGGIIAFQMGEGSSFIETIKRMGFWTLIPVLFITAGGFQMIKCIFFERLEGK